MKNAFFISLLLSLFVGSKIHAQNTGLLEKDSLDRYIHQAMEAWKIPGAAVCIIKDGEILLQKGYGVSNWDTKNKIDEQTIFPIASISKTFTGTLFATLEADSIISLNDLVKKWLPYFSMKDKLVEQQITLSDILSHRSGWKTFQGDLLNTESAMGFQLMIEKFTLQTPAYPIRTRFGYSNFGFMIAGESIKNITRQDYNTFLRSRLLEPLGMKRTFVFKEEIKNESNKVDGHTLVNDVLTILPPDKEEPYSHGGIYASVNDLGIWMRTLLNNGNLNGNNVIPESAINKMWQSHTIIGKSRAADRQSYFKTYGLGWEIMHYQNVEVINHGGAYAGALASLTLVPSLGLGIVILTNQDAHMLQETLKWQVVDAFLGKAAPNYTLNTIERQNKRKEESRYLDIEVEKDTEAFGINLDSIIGTYECEYYGNATIKQVKENYVLSLEYHPSIHGTLSPFKKEQLTCTYNHPMFGKVQFPFVIENNQVKSFTLFVDSFIEYDGYEFKKVE